MIDRYPTLPGCRLDGEDPMTGPAIDLGRTHKRAHLWVRESGTGKGLSVNIKLDGSDLRALRVGCTRLLVDLGLEEEITVTAPKRR